MTRAERLQEFWDHWLEKRGWPSRTEALGLSDAARFLNRGQPRDSPIIHHRTLQRRALSGALATIGGREKGADYTVLRAELIAHLCSLDSLSIPVERALEVLGPPAQQEPPPAVRRRPEQRKADEAQRNLFDGEL